MIILIGVFIILIPGAPLISITIWSQVLNAVLLPVVLVCMMIVVNKKAIMGEYVNNLFKNIVAIIITSMLIVMSIILIVYPLINKIIA